MPLVVPILRLFLLLLNVYETYKTLKSPPPSSRNGGRPSARARTQRKRDMKGCLAVWIVWCCFATYDRTLDGAVKLFVPFYDELKTVVIIFFILTRARGAEPIYLHIIRPIIKPHTDMLDSLLDIVCTAGDILFFLSTVPIHFAMSWWRDTFRHRKQTHPVPFHSPTRRKREANNESSQGDSTLSHSPPTQLPHTHHHVRRDSMRTYPPRRHPAEMQESSSGSPSLPVRLRLPDNVSTRTVRGPSRGRRYAMKPNSFQHRPPVQEAPQQVSSNHQIWYPPTAVETPSEDERSSFDNPPLPLDRGPSLPNDLLEGLTDSGAIVDEWRRYPPCPAAYPLSPSPAPPMLPFSQGSPSNGSSITPGARQVSIYSPQIPPIPGELSTGLQQGLARSSLPPRGPLDPGFLHNSSDVDSILDGPVDHSGNVSADDHNGSDNESSDRDDFDVTLTSPIVQIRTRSGVSNASTAGSVKSRPTVLTTTDNASSVRTRSNSESSGSISVSDSMSISDSSSNAQHNGSFPQAQNRYMASTIVQRTAVPQMAVSRESNQTITIHPLADVDDHDDRDEDDSSDSDSDDSSSSDSEEMEAERKRNLMPPKGITSTRATGDQKPARGVASSLNIPPVRPRPRPPLEAPPVGQRTSARLANRGTAPPPISRRVTAPAAGSSFTSVHVSSTVYRRASDRNPSKRK